MSPGVAIFHACSSACDDYDHGDDGGVGSGSDHANNFFLIIHDSCLFFLGNFPSCLDATSLSV